MKPEKDKRLHRILAISEIMRDGRRYRTRYFANMFGVDLRSIQRDFNALDQAGYTMEQISGRYATWRMIK